jgi:WD40 repeat protein
MREPNRQSPAEAHGRLPEKLRDFPRQLARLQLGPRLRHQDQVMAVAFSPDGKAVLTGSRDKTARLWKVLPPIQGEPEVIQLLSQVLTGMELDRHGGIRVLSADTWQARRRELARLGGPALP